MAIGSFAIGETQTPVTPQATAQNETVSTTYDDFEVSGDTSTISFSNSVLTISGGEHTISMAEGVESTSQTINVTGSATITLAGVNISAGTGAAMSIGTSGDVTVLLADGSTNILTTTDDYYAGLHKGDGGNTLTIGVPSGSQGDGILNATGGSQAAGIGGGSYGNGSNITISGGTVTATGGCGGAGIGGGYYGSGSEIEISDSTVTAFGSDADIESDFSYGCASAGIGGGDGGNGDKITITNSTVTATGGSGATAYDPSFFENMVCTAAAAIGGGGGFYCSGVPDFNEDPGTGSGNHLTGNSILIATGGNDGEHSKDPLDGFDETSDQGIAFVQKTDSDVSTGTMYNNVVLKSNLTMPENATLTIPQNKSLTINAGKTLTVPDGSVLTNDGTLTIKGTLSCTGTGKVETLLNYDKQLGRTKANDDNHVLYQDATEVKKYENMPSVEKEGYDLDGWYTKEKGQGTKVEEGDDILLNEHTLYANWIAEPEPTPTPPTPTPPGPEPTPTPPEPGPEPTPDPSVNPDGDSSGSGSSSKTSDPFMGGIALALLGVATAGAVLVRKRK